MSGIEAQYARLLRWYPRAWRDRNASAVIGAFLDQADETGRMTPSVSDRVHLIRGGLSARLSAGQPTIAIVATTVAFLVWYLAIVAGTFVHPSLLTLALLFAALVTAVAGQGKLTTLFTMIAAVSAVVIAFSPDGPGPSVTVVLSGLALIGSARGLRRGEVLMSIAAVSLAAVSAESCRSVVSLWPLVAIPQLWISAAVGIAAGASAMVLSAATLARRVSTRGDVAP